MRDNQSSRTAVHVAALRGLGPLLPPAARLIDDPWGAQWTGSAGLRRLAERMPATAQWLSRPVWKWLLYMQVRTFAIDSEITRFAESGGKQLVLLGAGLDARALRLRDLRLQIYEVDHPATQARKRPLVGDSATLVAWDFEREPLRQLPERLGELGYQRSRRGLVVWEGVSMYLSESAIEETFVMLRDLLADGSVLAFTYFSLERLHGGSWQDRLIRRLLARAGEPFRWGWNPETLASWLAARGFALEQNNTAGALAARWLPANIAIRLRDDQRRIAAAVRREAS